MEENTFENVVCQMAAILSRPQRVKMELYRGITDNGKWVINMFKLSYNYSTDAALNQMMHCINTYIQRLKYCLDKLYITDINRKFAAQINISQAQINSFFVTTHLCTKLSRVD